jgi:hypothetical protein
MGPRSMETDLKNHSTHSLHRALKNRRETKMGKWHRCINHLWALLLVEIGGAGVEHHGLDGEVPGVLLPVALLRHPLLDLHLPCNTHNPSYPRTTHACAGDLSEMEQQQRNAACRSDPLCWGSAHDESSVLPLVEPTVAASIGASPCVRSSESKLEQGGNVLGGWLRGLRSLDGEADAGEAARPAFEGAAARLHPPPDRGAVGRREGRTERRKCGWRLATKC